jgi:antitoxin component of MazEF toxin-antitoxin module
MKLQKQLSRKVGNKEYPKYVIVISPSIVKELGWREGEALKEEVKEGKLIISREKDI